VLAGHPLVLEEPAAESAALRWRSLLGAVLPVAGRDVLVVRRALPATVGSVVAETRALADVARDVAATYGPVDPRGVALDHARATVAAAILTLEGLAADGWSSILASPLDRPSHARLGADLVVERTETFDPFAPSGRAVRPPKLG
ncbi:MAG: hypothetical protein ACRDGQ_00210, partial [Candidatus Limnocylindrales bacterium]